MWREFGKVGLCFQFGTCKLDLGEKTPFQKRGLGWRYKIKSYPLADDLLWTYLCVPPNSYFEALPSMWLYLQLAF